MCAEWQSHVLSPSSSSRTQQLHPFSYFYCPFLSFFAHPPPPSPPLHYFFSCRHLPLILYHIYTENQSHLFIFYMIIHHKDIASYLRIFCTSLQVNVTKCSLRGGEPATKKRVENCPIVVSQTSVLIHCNDNYIYDD